MALKDQSLSVLTLNVWNREGPWPDRLPLIRSWLDRLQPDLIGLQEVADANHTQELLNGFGYHTEWMGTTSGVAIAARCSVVCNERVEGVWPSDHFGVLARMKIK